MAPLIGKAVDVEVVERRIRLAARDEFGRHVAGAGAESRGPRS